MSPSSFAYIDIPSGVDEDPIGSCNLAGLDTLGPVAQAGKYVALDIHDRDPGPKPIGLAVRSDGHVQLSHVDPQVTRFVDEQTARFGHVDPLGYELAVSVEDLHSLVFPVGHLDPTVLIMRQRFAGSWPTGPDLWSLILPMR